jgi:hypothetical protein
MAGRIDWRASAEGAFVCVGVLGFRGRNGAQQAACAPSNASRWFWFLRIAL